MCSPGPLAWIEQADKVKLMIGGIAWAGDLDVSTVNFGNSQSGPWHPPVPTFAKMSPPLHASPARQ